MRTNDTEVKLLLLARIRRDENIDPRKGRNKQRYAAFCASVRDEGILQAILVRPIQGDPDFDYEVVAGNTRWQGATDCGLEMIPATIRQMTDQEARIASAVENIQRADLTPIEEANAASILLIQTGNDHEEVCLMLGWSRTKLNARILLTQASSKVAGALLDGTIKLGHAELLSPLGHDDQDVIVQKIIDGNISVTDARTRLLSLTRRLEKATFDTAACVGCVHNSSAYADLFAESVGAGQCQNLTCWNQKVDDHLTVKIEDAKAEFGLVYRSDEVPEGGYIVIATDGQTGVGRDQAGACRSCESYGAVISTRNGEEGNVAGRFCFNSVCNTEKVTAYQDAVSTAVKTVNTNGAGTTAQQSVAANTPVVSPKPNTAGKPLALRTALRRVLHTTHTQLAVRHMRANASYGYAQAITCTILNLRGEVDGELLQAVMVEAGIPELPHSVKERVKYIADLAAMDEETLLQLLVKLGALAALRKMTDFEDQESALLSKLIVERHDLSPSDVFTVNDEFLKILTKAELLGVCRSSGFDKAYDEKHGDGHFKKLVGGSKVGEIASAMMALEDFDWGNYLPIFLQNKAKTTPDTAAAA